MSIDISYNVIGNGEPIIFIHGIGSRKYSWNRVIEELKNDYRCITYDLRGHGDSKIDINKFDLNDLVEDIEKLRSYLNIDKAHLVGHSLGGMISPSYARKYSHRVISISLLSTAAFRSVSDKNKLLYIIKKIENEGLDSVIPTLINRWFTDDFINNNQKIINTRIKQLKETPLKIFLNVFQLYALTEIGSWLSEINNPSLVITGEFDIGCNPKLNNYIAEALPNSKLEILDNLKHAIILESPELIGTKIKKFLHKL